MLHQQLKPNTQISQWLGMLEDLLKLEMDMLKVRAKNELSVLTPADLLKADKFYRDLHDRVNELLHEGLK